jgi:hypothetical protein
MQNVKQPSAILALAASKLIISAECVWIPPLTAFFWRSSLPRAAHSGREGFSAQDAETAVKRAKVVTPRNISGTRWLEQERLKRKS